MNYFEILNNGLTPYLGNVFGERIGDTRAESQTGLDILQEVKNLVLAYRLPTEVAQKPDDVFYPNLRRVIALSSNLVERIRNTYQVIERCRRLRDQLSEVVLQRRRARLTPANYTRLNQAEQNAFDNTENLTVADVLADIRRAVPTVQYLAAQSQHDQEYHNTLLLLRKNVTAQAMYVFVKRELEALLRRMRERFNNISVHDLERRHGLSQDDVSYLTTRDYIVRDISANHISLYYGRSIDLVRNTHGYVETVKQRIANLVSTYLNNHYRAETFKQSDYAQVYAVNQEIKRNLKLLDRWSIERTNDVNEMFRDLEQHDRYTTKIERIKFELQNNANGGGALAMMNAYKMATRNLSLTQSLQQQRFNLMTVLRDIKQRVYNMNRHFSLLVENHLSVNGTLHSLENMFSRITELTGEQTAYTFDQFLRQTANKFFDANGNPRNNNGDAMPLDNIDNHYNQLVRNETQNLNHAFAQIDNVRLRNEEHDALELAQQQIFNIPLIRLEAEPEQMNVNHDAGNHHGNNNQHGGGGGGNAGFVPAVLSDILRIQKKT